ncbi:hypothetical protein A2715_00945 [Candidatus Woesebacteria bacterium RIFCSPHIGHO2_01_FULL_39_32]|nr:MAG: hypothetical protein A2124_04710 [Candidatus Woesebacteria bacterium GWB1_37_5]OGM24478.1 MAG: hypothetical protein A2715_00945 [Candidatus Woesebacteria bacterium RIFCSPHIGHO2_01_FULL_39_32]OGM38699.1 MAG: hypothetical protein A3F01_05975 [Candidatus Woesebacteria bacterium RIFCSPHIGHO2_12_FULL_38_11]OGM63784.1 MAG: hypothetical protein A2893_02280 [Candidatus Woesebacteria bacterium RIFCSPLOWO2_01_FULL_39_25]
MLAIFFNKVTLPVSVYVVFGSLIALTLLYLYFYFVNHRLPHFKYSPALLGIFTVAAVKGIIWYRALQIYPVAQAMLIHNLAPVVALLFAPILIKEKPHFNHFIAVITGFLGLSLLLQFNGDKNALINLGAIFALGAAFASGLQDIFHRKLSPSVTGLEQAFIFVLGQALGSVIFLLPNLPSTITWVDLSHIAIFGIFGTAIPIILLASAFKKLRSFEVATLGYTEPALGALWGSLFLKQPILPSTAIGGLLIFLSGLTAIREDK